MSSSPDLNLLLEEALKALIEASESLPEDFVIHPAHRKQNRDEGATDYIVILARRGEEMAPGFRDMPVEFQIFTGVADNDDRGARIAIHSERSKIISSLFDDDNFAENLAALNAPILEGIGFNGWEEAEEQPDDTYTETQITARLSYGFQCYFAA